MSRSPKHPAPGGARPRGKGLRVLLSAGQFALAVLVVGGVATVGAIVGHRTSGKTHLAIGKTAEQAAVVSADVTALYASTPELVAKGKTLFTTNCSACHGVSGRGDGAAATALNPKPRNFTSAEGWKYGAGMARVVRTISQGSPGTAMAAFAGLPLAERMALAHYIRSLQPSPAEDKPEDKTWLGVGEPGKAGAVSAAAAAPVAGPSIPIEVALKKLAEADAPPGVALATPPAGGAGSALFEARCAGCHGRSGEGGVKVKMLGSSPYAYVTTKSLASGPGPWASNPAAFERMVIEGFPGTLKVSNGDLSREAIRDLHLYTQMLRIQQETAARSGS
jgi:mono/diheme cytochrome c family protein